jgi:multiple sugar transport system substrate-binding protein
MKTQHKANYLVLMTVLVASVLLSSCGQATPTAATNATEVPQAATPGEVVTLNVWIFEDPGSFFDELVNDFTADHPNIKVEITDISESEYTTKIDTALIAGETPDVGFIYEKKWIKAGEFLALDDMLAEQGIRVADYYQGALNSSCVYDGKVYCLGTYNGAELLFYNKDLFDAAGVPYPSATDPMTMDEYVAMCAKLTKKSEVLDEKVWGCKDGIPIWWQDYLNFFSEDGRTIVGYVNDDATVHTFEMLAQERADGSVISDEDATALEGTDLLATGKLATSITDNVTAIRTLDEAGINWGATLVPVEQKGDKPWVTSFTDSWGVFTNSKHPHEAELFVAYLGTKGNEIRLSKGELPLNMTLAEQWASQSQGRQEAVAAMMLSRSTVFVPGFWDVTAPLWDGFSGSIMEDGRPAKEVLDELAPQMQESLDQAWETWDSIH